MNNDRQSRYEDKRKAMLHREDFDRELSNAHSEDDVVAAIRANAIEGQIWLQASLNEEGRFENSAHVVSLILSGSKEMGDYAIRDALQRIRILKSRR